MGKSYVAALNDILKPLGFSRHGAYWKRETGEYTDSIELQKSSFSGSTINLVSLNHVTIDLLRRHIPDYQPSYNTQRLGILIDNYDHRWTVADNGPAKMADAVMKYGMPYLEGMHSLEAQGGILPSRHSAHQTLAPSRRPLASRDDPLSARRGGGSVRRDGVGAGLPLG